MNGETPLVSQLRLPMQVAPINRTPGGAALADGSGVEAAGWFDDIVNTVVPIAKTVGPPLLSALGI